eukprot:m.126995 g.126995  ORF g.126995 m.126995 type:complete len:264 (-) comp14698_c1_seq6:259-1050(-)
MSVSFVFVCIVVSVLDLDDQFTRQLHSMTRAQAATIIQAHWRGHLLRSRLAAVLTSSYHEHDDEFEFEDVDMGDFDFDESKFDAEFSELPDTARPRRAPKQAFATPAPSQPPSSPPHTRAWTQASSTTASTVTSPSKSSKVDSLANEWGFDKATAALMLKRARHLGPRAQHKGPRPAPPRHAPVPAPAPVHTHMHAHAHPAAARPAPPSQADSPAETRVQSCWDHPPPSKKPLAMRAYPVLPDIAPGSSRSSSADSTQRPRGK